MKKIFGKGGIIDNETRRWDKAVDQATRDLDTNTAEALGMEKGAKPGHVLNPESIHHKEAVNFFKGKDTTPSVSVNTEEHKDSEAKDEGSVTTSTPVIQAETIVPEANTTSTVEPVISSKTSEETEESTKKVDEEPSVAETNTPSSSDAKILEWARILLDHKELTSGDKMGLPHFIKTSEDVNKLISKIFELASHEEDVSYITVSTDLVAAINDLYSGEGLLG